MNTGPVLDVLRHTTFRRLFAAQVVALAGTGLATVALGLLAFRLAGDAAGQVLGLVFAIKMVAYVVVAPLATAALARLPRRTVLVAADLIRLVVALALPFVDQPWQVYLLVFGLQAASATFTPTFQAVIPQVLPDERRYTQALSLSRLAYDLEAVASPMLAAALLVLVPSSALFFGTAAGFAGSALLVLSIGRRWAAPASSPVVPTAPPAAPPTSPLPPPLPRPTFRQRAGHGIAIYLRSPALRPVLLLNLAVAAVGAFVLVQTVVIARSALGGTDTLVAVLLGVMGAASMATALVLPRLLERLSDRTVMLVGAAALVVAGTATTMTLILGPTLPVIGLLWLLVGAAWSATETPVGRIIRRSAPAADLPAVFAAQFSLSHAGWLLCYPLAGWLGAADLAVAAGVLTAVAAAATAGAVALWPSGRRAPAAAAVPSSMR